MDRAEIVKLANEVGTSCPYGGAPVLTETSPLPDVLRWLQWCDGNGSYIPYVWHEGSAYGYLEEGWYVINYYDDREGPFTSKEKALDVGYAHWDVSDAWDLVEGMVSDV